MGKGQEIWAESTQKSGFSGLFPFQYVSWNLFQVEDDTRVPCIRRKKKAEGGPGAAHSRAGLDLPWAAVCYARVCRSLAGLTQPLLSQYFFLLRFVFSFSDICSRICFLNPNCLKRISEDF
jgi:hypothetical protein